jgi:hypothetical protein
LIRDSRSQRCPTENIFPRRQGPHPLCEARNPFAELLKDVLPVADTLNQETVRDHLHAVANRIEQELSDEQLRLFEGSDRDWEEQPLPDGPMTVGIDGGFVRAHKEGWFEVIAGKSGGVPRNPMKGPRPSVSDLFRLMTRNRVAVCGNC